MHFTSWLDSFRNRSRQVTRRHSVDLQTRVIECLEDRTLLSVTTLFLDGELAIVSDAGDNIVVQESTANPGTVEVLENGVAANTIATVFVNQVSSIVVRGGNEANTIDLSGVDASVFTALTSILVEGMDGGDTIDGSSDIASLLFGGDGDDTINGGAAGDTIDGGDGDDVIDGAAGDDDLSGEDGNDSINGSEGFDTISGGDGQDTLAGDEDDDSLNGNNGQDQISGNDGDDTLNGDFGTDALNGNDGNDVLNGGIAADVLNGGSGDDTLEGMAGQDTLLGGTGDDRLEGGVGGDLLQGNEGDDLLAGMRGRDSLEGGTGSDTIFGGSGNDTLRGNEGGDFLRGQGGNDTLFSGVGFDELDGGAGNDMLDSIDRGFIISDVPGIIEGDGGAISVRAFFDDFDSGIGPEFSGVTTTEDVQAFAGVGTGTNIIGGDFLRNDTGGTAANPGSVPQARTRLSLTNLVKHTSIDLNFIFAAINSWNGINDPTGADFFNVTVDGTSVFRENFSNEGTAQGYFAPTGVQLTSGPFVDLGFAPPVEADSAYDLGVDPVFDSIPHTGSSLTIEFFADGLGFEGGDDESWAIDNVEVILNGTPVMGTASFTVELNLPLTRTVTVDFNTQDITAQAGLDYQVTSGTLTFAPGDLTKTISVPILGDTVDEPDETFLVKLSNVSSGGQISRREGVGTILDDDSGTGGPAPPPVSLYDIELVFGGGLTVSQMAAFLEAEQRIESIIIGDVPDVMVPGFGLVDDVVINASGVAIDGPGGILGQAGPTDLRMGSFLPSAGIMQFDTADLLMLESGGQLVDTILHEMMHVIGFGTIWQNLNLLVGAGGGNPQFTGPLATAEYNATFGLNDSAVPVANMGGPGTADSHWRESVFNNELMTGFLNPGVNPFSRMTIGSLADLGYQVDFAAADPFMGNQSGGSVTKLGILKVLDIVPRINDVFVNSGVNLEQESNDTIDTAQNVDNENFTLNSDPNIGDTLGDTSTTIPHITIDGTGDGTFDYFSFTIANAGDRAIFDVDNGFTSFGTGSEDLELHLYDSNGNSLATNDDFNENAGGGGSETSFGLDPYLEFTFGAPGLYIIGVGAFPSTGNPGGITGSTVSPGTTYQLQLSIEDQAPAPVGGQGDTLLGGTGDDTLRGETGDDELHGGSGDDILMGFEGTDLLFGGAGDDTLDGGDDSDTLRGQGGNDILNGNDGDDELVWNGEIDGRDSLDGGQGADTVRVVGDKAVDRFTVGQIGDPVGAEMQITEGTGSVTISDEVEIVTIDGRQDNDRITVGDLDQVTGVFLVISGNSGNDRLTAATADIGDVRLLLIGGAGDDTLTGSMAGDTLRAGDGDDELKGGAGDDSMDGGIGHDVLNGQQGDDTLLGAQGNDSLEGGTGNDSLVGSDGIDSLHGEDGDDTLEGGMGSDWLFGDDGEDSLTAGDGDDKLFGGSGRDTLDGGFGDDTLRGQVGNDTLRGDHGDDFLDGDIGDDVMDGGDGDDTLHGGAGNDAMSGMDGNDNIIGSAGNDIITGGDGRDTLLGGRGQDIVIGGDGDDRVDGQGGSNDTLAGGEGNDTVVGAASEIDESFVLSPEMLDALDTTT